MKLDRERSTQDMFDNIRLRISFLFSLLSLDTLITVWGMFTRSCVSTKAYHEILYYYGTTPHRIRYPNKRTGWLCHLVKATSNGDDVTKKVLEYAGPNFDFHTIYTTPALLELQSLDLDFLDGSKVHVAYLEQINLFPKSE